LYSSFRNLALGESILKKCRIVLSSGGGYKVGGGACIARIPISSAKR
jgi:hypothetical protein